MGILGATVMPHSLFLGSALATQDRISSKPTKELIPPFNEQNSKPTALSHLRKALQRFFAFIISSLHVPPRDEADDHLKPKHHSDRENNSLSFVQAHLYHGTVDMTISLLGVAVLINSLYVFLRPYRLSALCCLN